MVLAISSLSEKVHAEITVPLGFEVSVFASTGLNNPNNLAFDSSGNLFVTNAGGPLSFSGDCNGFVTKITPDGIATTFAAGHFTTPNGLAIDNSDFLFVSDVSAGPPCNPNEISVFRISPTGVVQEFAGDYANDGVANALQLVFDSFGNLILADNALGGLFKIKPSGEVSVFDIGYVIPFSIAIDIAGNLFVGDRGLNTIERITPTGEKNTFATNIDPFGLSFDNNGKLFVAERSSGRILILDDANGNSVVDQEEVSTFASGLEARNIAFDNVGNLFVVEQSMNRIIKISHTNPLPIANAGSDQIIYLGETAQLDGSGSSAPNEEPLSYLWDIESAPAGSIATLSGSTIPNPTLTPDIGGQYIISLVVSDGVNNSIADTISINVNLNMPPNARAMGALPGGETGPTDGLVFHYPFNGNANDESGNGNNGTVNGATLAQDRFGNGNSAYSFDGVNDYIAINDNQVGNLGSFATISFWFYPNAENFSGGAHRILEKDDKAYWSFVIEGSSHLVLYLRSINSYGPPEHSIIILPGSGYEGKWTFITVVKRNNVFDIFENGVLIKSETTNLINNNIVNNRQANLGRSDFWQAQYFSGMIDEARIYNQALSEAEIQGLYNKSPITGDAPLTVSFNGSSSSDPEGGALTFEWDFGDPSSPDNTSTLEKPSHTYIAPGTYTAILTVTDDFIIPNTDQASVEVVVTGTNNPPIVDCLDNVYTTSEEVCIITINGTASDQDAGDILQYRWKEGQNVLQDWLFVDENGDCPISPCGLDTVTHTLTLEVSDGIETSYCEKILTIDNSSPHVAPSGAGTYQIGEPVNLGGYVSDYDGDTLSYEWKEGANVLSPCYGTINTVVGGTPVELLPACPVSNLSLGTHTITINVSDGINDTVSGEIIVTIIDNTKPTLAPVINNGILWPPNHNMVDINITANAEDDSGLPVTLSAIVSSNELQEGLGDGDMAPDWTEPVIDNDTGTISLQLRAERSGSENGRVYTVAVTATDSSNNSSTANVEVIVPHDKKKK